MAAAAVAAAVAAAAARGEGVEGVAGWTVGVQRRWRAGGALSRRNGVPRGETDEQLATAEAGEGDLSDARPNDASRHGVARRCWRCSSAARSPSMSSESPRRVGRQEYFRLGRSVARSWSFVPGFSFDVAERRVGDGVELQQVLCVDAYPTGELAASPRAPAPPPDRRLPGSAQKAPFPAARASSR